MSKGGKRTTETKSTPIVPTAWQGNYDTTMGGLRDLTTGPSLTPNQTLAADFFGHNLDNPAYSLARPRSVTPGTVSASPVSAGTASASPITATMAEGSTPYSASEVGYTPFSANRGTEFLKDYENQYTKDVVDTSLADYDVGTERALAAERARRGAGAAFGTGADVADAIFSGEAGRGRGALSASLRSNAFNTAAGLGMQDADRFSTVAGANAANRLSADTFNAGSRNSAASQAMAIEAARREANAGRTQGASMFNSGQAFDAGRFNAGQKLTADTFNSGQTFDAGRYNTTNAFDADRFNVGNEIDTDRANVDLKLANDDYRMRNAGGLAALGGEEFRQKLAPWELMLQALNTGTSTFGQSGTNTEKYKPGLFDWASLATGAAASYFGGKK